MRLEKKEFQDHKCKLRRKITDKNFTCVNTVNLVSCQSLLPSVHYSYFMDQDRESYIFLYDLVYVPLIIDPMCWSSHI